MIHDSTDITATPAEMAAATRTTTAPGQPDTAVELAAEGSKHRNRKVEVRPFLGG